MEIWRKVEGHPNYSISNYGRVIDDRTGRELCQNKNKKPGWYRVYIDGRKEYVHRLVAQTFLDKPDDCDDVIHLDGNPDNNCVGNLEWGRRSRSIARAKEKERRRKENGIETIEESFPYKIHPIRCYQCKHRNENDYCSSKPPYFYCYDGEL